jgi:hypothetical protein
MQKRPELESEADPFGGDLYRAGQWVPPGVYKAVEGERVLGLAQGGHLPASLDGRVACYRRVWATWGEIASGIERQQERAAGERVYSPGRP